MVALEDLSPSQQTCVYGAYAMLARCRAATRTAVDPRLFDDDRIEAYRRIAENWETAVHLVGAAGLTPPSIEVVTLLRWLGAILDMPEGDDDDQ